jgi:carbon-monoxide dehydrogenase large subunit
VYYGWGIPMVPGHEQCQARMSPDGVLELRIGAHSHGQGMETSFAQIANSLLGVDPANVRLIHGDTALTPYSTGTWGSRCAVMSGGAVATACQEIGRRVKQIAGKLMEVAAEDLELAEGRVRVAGTDRSMTLAEVAHVWYRQPQLLPADVDPGGLETTAGYKAVKDTGTFSYACHAVAVAVDTELGHVDILDYAICEDGGTLINPLIVDGQIYGGLAQGIGTALYEEMPYSEDAQPLASTLADYMLPGPTEVPEPRVDHMETPSPLTFFGQKGIGEGGAIAPPAAIANAINDALAPLGVEMLEAPVSPRRILAALSKARA